MLIRKATGTDEQELKNLWQVVFQEGLDFLEKFFSSRFAPDNVFLIEEDGMIVSALHALPVQFLDIRKGVVAASYIVGAATLEAYRKRGYMENLLKSVIEDASSPVLLYPAVRPYYEKNGFISCSTSKTYDIGGILDCTVEDPHVSSSSMETGESQGLEVDYNLLNKAYEASISRNGGLLRDAVAWKFIVDEYGYDIIHCKTAAGYAYAFVRDGQAVETAAQTLQAAEQLIAKLCEHHITRVRVIVGSELDTVLAMRKTPYAMRQEGMSFPDITQNPYIGEQY